MIELKLGPRKVDLPFTVRLPNVTEEMFDHLVDEDTKAELFDGVMIVHSPATPQHDDIGGFIRALMRFFAELKKLGKVLGPDSLVRLKSGRKFAPDAYFIDQRRVPRRLPPKQFNGAPDLALEVLSPSNWEYDLEDKRRAYREAGVREIWLVDPGNQRVIVDRKRGKSYSTITLTEGRVHSSVITGFWIEAGWLWAEPMPAAIECLHQIVA
jgi:Uma2 family endonuclease